jgi:phospholipid/cholesterol/gamma-HCH transport system permease protein
MAMASYLYQRCRGRHLAKLPPDHLASFDPHRVYAAVLSGRGPGPAVYSGERDLRGIWHRRPGSPLVKGLWQYGGFLSTVLVREIAPVLVGLIMIGRSGSTLLVELGTMKTEGQIHMLDALGIDPFLYLVVPRVLAFCVCMFSLTTAFVAVALLAGFASGTLFGLIQFTFFDFIHRAIGSMGRQTYLLFTLKTVTIGFAVALISCKTALSLTDVSARVLDIMSRGFAKSALATLIISIALTILLK